MTSLTVGFQFDWHAQPGRGLSLEFGTFDQLKLTGFIILHHLHVVVEYRVGFSTHHIPCLEQVFCLGIFTDANEKFPALFSDHPLDFQGIAEITVASFVK
jgi:hypothetical protein